MRDERNVSLPASARNLRRELGRVRRKARMVLLGEAFLAAIAADLLYDLLSLGLFLLTGINTYFPPFFLVVLSVLILSLLLKTRLLPFSRSLDRKHRLKERLTSAFFYQGSDSVPAPIREAQARETLEAVDFSSLRGSYAFRPIYSTAAIVFLVAALGGVMWKYPGLFKPANFVYRQGARVVSSYQHGGPAGDQLAMSSDPSSEESGANPAPDEDDSNPAAEKAPAPPDETGGETDPGEETPERVVKEKKEMEDPPEKNEEPPRQPGPPDREQEIPPPKEGKPPRPSSSNQGGVIMKSRSVETTEEPSPLADKPYWGLAPEPLGFTFREAEAYLPPIPLFRLLMKDAAQGALIDPESVTIVPEAYQERYRRHIVAYFEKLQSLREEQDGP